MKQMQIVDLVRLNLKLSLNPLQIIVEATADIATWEYSYNDMKPNIDKVNNKRMFDEKL